MCEIIKGLYWVWSDILVYSKVIHSPTREGILWYHLPWLGGSVGDRGCEALDPSLGLDKGGMSWVCEGH